MAGKRMWLWCVGLAMALTGSVTAGDFYVSPVGDDSAAGTATAPFRTIERAQQAVRERLKARPAPKQPIVVQLEAATFHLTKPIVFEPGDSGTKAAPVIYQGAPKGGTLISGGIVINQWKVDNERSWYALLSDGGKGIEPFSQLFVNGGRRYRPRLPREGYFRVTRNIASGRGEREAGEASFGFAAGDVPAELAGREEVELVNFHPWFTTHKRIKSVEADKGIVTFTQPLAHNRWFMRFHKDQRYIIDNVKEALGERGQWYYDRERGWLTYLPLEGEEAKTTTAVAPQLRHLVIFRGDEANKQWVQHIELRGLRLAHSNWVVEEKLKRVAQSATEAPAAIHGEGVRHVSIVDCGLSQLSGCGIAFTEACQHLRIEGCELKDLGAGGIQIGSKRYKKDQQVVTQRNIIRDNLIAHGGRYTPSAAGIWIGHASQNTVEENEILDFYYTGISVGWRWGYADSNANFNRIHHNHIHHLGFGVMSDMGGIYTLGPSAGTILRYNRIHHVLCDKYGGWGIYLDEGTSQLVAMQNIVYRCTDGNFNQHYGRDNTIQENIFAHARDAQIGLSKEEPHSGFHFWRNVVVYRTGRLFRQDSIGRRKFAMDHNLFWREGGEVRFDDMTLAQWRKTGRGEGSTIADPHFADAAGGDFRLTKDSPREAFKAVGIRMDEVLKAGCAEREPYDYDPARWPPAFAAKPWEAKE